MSYHATKVHTGQPSPVDAVARKGAGVLVQCIDGIVEPPAALSNGAQGTTLSFVVDADQAVPWLNDAVRDCRLGDVLHLCSESAGSRTLVVRFVGPIFEVDLSRADAHRQEGNALLTKPDATSNEFRRAIDEYERALQLLARTAGNTSDRVIPIRLNIALANLRLKVWTRVTEQCDAVLALDARNVKALYRRARASLERGRFQPAIEDLRAANELSPNDGAIKQHLEHAVNKQYALIQMNRQKFAEVYAKMLESPIFEKQSVVS